MEEHKLNLENQVFKYLKVFPDKDPTVAENVAYSLDTIVTQVTETEQNGLPAINIVLKVIKNNTLNKYPFTVFFAKLVKSFLNRMQYTKKMCAASEKN